MTAQLDFLTDLDLDSSRQPLSELGPFMQYMVLEHPDSDHAKAWNQGLRRERGEWVKA